MIGKTLIGLGVWVVLGVVVLLLSGCMQLFTYIPSRNWPPYYNRTKAVYSQTQWGSQGQGTFKHAGGDGSGQMTWKQDGGILVIELIVPRTRQHLSVRAILGESLCVDGLEQGRVCGEDASRQLTALFGEPLPLDPLSFWLRGVSEPLIGGGPVDIANSGLTKSHSQSGWLITYKRWHPATDTRPALPRRMVITKGDARLSFVIEDWSWGARE